jgi:cytochrome c biogenesis protein CcmG/thiol:disulfide interchange protein DsbE
VADASQNVGAGPGVAGFLSGRRWLLLLPVGAFALVAAALGIGLIGNPREIPSALIGKPVPVFTLPPVKGRTLGLSSDDLKGEVSLVNVFASWCVPCLSEHPIFLRLNRKNVVAIHGINYKNNPDDAAQWLDRYGDPYTRTGADLDGRVAIDWGVYGVPETFVVDRAGRIVFKQIGPVTPQILNEQILPLITKLRQ